ncbi:hypothetical protein V6N13_046368 [Hibiscus sabdariffa]|uniref:Uncharacterized protein n=1 Tax=Hibiscus sabdariffa TaxID=183260 RepID=A0ABR2D9Y5_9ROSI
MVDELLNFVDMNVELVLNGLVYPIRIREYEYFGNDARGEGQIEVEEVSVEDTNGNRTMSVSGQTAGGSNLGDESVGTLMQNSVEKNIPEGIQGLEMSKRLDPTVLESVKGLGMSDENVGLVFQPQVVPELCDVMQIGGLTGPVHEETWSG